MLDLRAAGIVGLVVSLGLGLPACRSAESAAPAEPAPAKAAPAPAFVHGQPLAAAETVPLETILSAPDDFKDKTVTVEGSVRRNCTNRGCWMELASGMAPDLPGCRVTFKNYGFFVPTDSAGSRARVQGTVNVKTVTPGEVAHLENEGARFAHKEADGSSREVRLVATGVELRRGG